MTEMITGIDLIQEQIRVAMGEKLRFKQVGGGWVGGALSGQNTALQAGGWVGGCVMSGQWVWLGWWAERWWREALSVRAFGS